MGRRSSSDVVIARFSGAAIAYLAGVTLFLAGPLPGVTLFQILTDQQPPPSTKAVIIAICSAAMAAWLTCFLLLVGVRAAFGGAALYVRDGRLISIAPLFLSLPVANIVKIELGPSGPFVDAPMSIQIILKGGVRKRVSIFLASRPAADLAEGFERAGICCVTGRGHGS